MLHSHRAKQRNRNKTGVRRVTAPSTLFKPKTFDALQRLPVSSAILDPVGTIVEVNDAWKKFARDNGLRTAKYGIGQNYIDFCSPKQETPTQFAADLKRLLARKLDLITLVYPCHSPTEERWFSLIGLPLSASKSSGVAILHIDLSKRLHDPLGGAGMTVKAGEKDGAVAHALSSAVEQSVAQSLSSQLQEMFADPAHRSHSNGASEKKSKRAELMAIQERLTKRQHDVFRLLGKGKSNSEIARLLLRSPNTIKLHVSAILKQLDVKNRTQAAVLASQLFNH